MERYVFVVRVTVEAGELVAGDRVQIVYGDTSGGSRGMRAAIVSTRPEHVLVAIDPDGSGEFHLVSHDATLTSRAGVATEVMLIGPSDLVVDEAATLHISAVDSIANAADRLDEEITLRVVQGNLEAPSRVRLIEGRGYQSVTVTPRSPGVIRLEAETREGLLRARSNPMRAHEEAPAERLYWRDLHSHTRHSWDGVGNGVFDYARNVAALDFHAVTDHSQSRIEGYTRGLGPEVWQAHWQNVDAHNEPGECVIIHGYEASFGPPYGHHNVYFRSAPGPLLAPDRVTLPELWSQLTAGEALTIPHHTGKFPQPLRVDDHDHEFRRNFEIYSAHGLSEAYDPDHPLAFEQGDFTNYSTSAPEGLFARDVWVDGLVLSTVAASDDHRSHPGRPHWGIAAVTAPVLTRDAIFDGLYRRRTYGTTGAHILLDFRVNGEPMGRLTDADRPPRIAVAANGTDVIDSVEVFRYSEPDRGFTLLHHAHPDALDFEWSGLDRGFRGDSIYYVRLRQQGTIRGRVVMAWSSPIWVRRLQ